MECFVLKKDGEKSLLDLPSNIFDVKYNGILLHQFVVSYIGNSHIGVKKQKSRGEVRGGGKKPWTQKGSGRARVGSIRSPLWRGGGKIFAATGCASPKRKLNKKMYRLGMKIIFSELFRNNRIVVVDNLLVDTCKTQDFLKTIEYLNISGSSLFVVDDICSNLYLSTRNLKDVVLVSYKNLSPVDLMKFKNIIILRSAIDFIKERFK